MTVVVKELVINIYIFFGWIRSVVVFYHYWNCLRSFADVIFFSKIWSKLSTLYCIIIAT